MDDPLTIKERVAAGIGLLWLVIGPVAAALLVAGCSTKTRNVEIDGMFTQAEAGILAVGSVDVMAAPVGEESAIIKYEEDTAWLSPATKTHSIRIQLTGTNCTSCVTSIVSSICGAFVPVVARSGGATNAVLKVER